MPQSLTIVIIYEHELSALVNRFDQILSGEGFRIEIDYKYRKESSSVGWIPVMNRLIGTCHAGVEVRTVAGYKEKSPRSIGEEILVARAVQLPLYRTFSEPWKALDDGDFVELVKSDMAVWLRENARAIDA